MSNVKSVWAGLKGRIALVPTSIDNGDDPGTCYGELLAISHAHSLLRQFYPPSEVTIVDSRRWKNDSFTPQGVKSLLVLGSCHRNHLAANLYGEEGENVYFQHSDSGQSGNHAVRVSSEGEWHSTVYTPGHELGPHYMEADYGVIVWREDTDGNRTISFIGAHTYGTYAGVVYVMSDKFCDWYASQNCPQNFQILIKISELCGYYDDGDEHPIECIETSIKNNKLPPTIYNPVDINTSAEETSFGVHYRKLSQHNRMVQFFALIAWLALIAATLLIVLEPFLNR